MSDNHYGSNLSKEGEKDNHHQQEACVSGSQCGAVSEADKSYNSEKCCSESEQCLPTNVVSDGDNISGSLQDDKDRIQNINQSSDSFEQSQLKDEIVKMTVNEAKEDSNHTESENTDVGEAHESTNAVIEIKSVHKALNQQHMETTDMEKSVVATDVVNIDIDGGDGQKISHIDTSEIKATWQQHRSPMEVDNFSTALHDRAILITETKDTQEIQHEDVNNEVKMAGQQDQSTIDMNNLTFISDDSANANLEINDFREMPPSDVNVAKTQQEEGINVNEINVASSDTEYMPVKLHDRQEISCSDASNAIEVAERQQENIIETNKTSVVSTDITPDHTTTSFSDFETLTPSTTSSMQLFTQQTESKHKYSDDDKLVVAQLDNNTMFSDQQVTETNQTSFSSVDVIGSSMTTQQPSHEDQLMPYNSISKRFDNSSSVQNNAHIASSLEPSISNQSSPSSIVSGVIKSHEVEDKNTVKGTTRNIDFSSLWNATTKTSVDTSNNDHSKTESLAVVPVGGTTTTAASSRWEQFTEMLAKQDKYKPSPWPSSSQKEPMLNASPKNDWVTFDDDMTNTPSSSSFTLHRRNTTVGYSSSRVFSNPFSPRDDQAITAHTVFRNPFQNPQTLNNLDNASLQVYQDKRRKSANPFAAITEHDTAKDNTKQSKADHIINIAFISNATTTTTTTTTATAGGSNFANQFITEFDDTTNNAEAKQPAAASEEPTNAIQVESNALVSNIPHSDSLSESEEELRAEDEVEVVPFYDSSIRRFDMLLRVPEQKKRGRRRNWKKVIVEVDGPKIKLYEPTSTQSQPFTETSLQACYCLTKPKFSKYEHHNVHVTKLRFISYKEVRRFTGKYDMILHKNTVFKFGVLLYATLMDFTQVVQNTLFQMPGYRSFGITYHQEKVKVDVLDECRIWLSSDGSVFYANTCVRIMVLAFVAGMTPCSVELNDRKSLKKVSKKETGAGKSIAAMSRYELASLGSIRTDHSWVRIKNSQFHCCVERKVYFRNAIIQFKPVDGCEFQLMRFEVPHSTPMQTSYSPVGAKTADVSHVMPLLATVKLQNDKHHVQVTATISLPANVDSFNSVRNNVRLIIPIPPDWKPLFRGHKNVISGKHMQPLRVVHNKSATIPQRLKKSVRAVIAINTGNVKYRDEFAGLVWEIGNISSMHLNSNKKYMFVCQTLLLPSMELPRDYDDPPRALLEFTIPFAHASGVVVRSVKIGPKVQPESCISYLSTYRYFIEMTGMEHSLDDDNLPSFTQRVIDHGCVQQ